MLGILPFLPLAFYDILDGYLSRKFKCETKLGAQMDSWADKILVMPTIILILIFYQLGSFFHGALILLTIWLIVAEMINIYQRVLKKDVKYLLRQTNLVSINASFR